MIYFKLSLLTPQFIDNSNYFFEDVISEFYAQEDAYKTNKYSDIQILSESNNQDLWDIINNTLTVESFLSIKNQKAVFCYSYNEKLKISKNAQKTLSFSMNRMITVENEWKENPFIRNIVIGSQLLLIDQYNNETFFTVKDIKYNIKENNIIYEITCQDSFSYQTIRQNSGYTIENESTSEDFIGALTLDEWVEKYIVPDCKIAYTYIPLTYYLYEDINNNIKKASYEEFESGNLNDVKRIIKYGYNPTIEYEDETRTKIKDAHDSAFFDTIPFSCSGSNANAALISLAEQMGFVLNVCEHNIYDENKYRSREYNRYFWLEAEKNTNRLGLTYSPRNSIQSFNFSHKGDSLTTILNIENNTIDDEVISLFPTIPPFFYQYFMTTDWEKSKYHSGMFSELCKDKIYYYNNKIDINYSFKAHFGSLGREEPYNNYTLDGQDLTEDFETIDFFPTTINNELKSWYDDTEDFLYIPIWNQEENTLYTFNVPALYEYLSFKDPNTQKISDLIDNRDTIITSRGCAWDLVLLNSFEDDSINKYHIYIIRENIDKLPIINKGKIFAFIRIRLNTNSRELLQINVNSNLFLNFYRNATDEELEFAEIADTCPWLENKLIDFSYFYNNKILSKEEYASLMDTLYNKLRIINGRLMFFSQAYYRALHNRTEILANLTNSLDMLGATCQSDIIDPMKEKGVIENFDSFRNSYLSFTAPVERPIELLDYNDILTDYFNKYFGAEQRFLKNIYNFTNYFNAPNSLNYQSLYTYKLLITDNLNEKILETKPLNPQNWTPVLNKDGIVESYYADTEYDYYHFASNFKVFTHIDSNFILYDKNKKSEFYGCPQVNIFLYKNDNSFSSIEVVHKNNYTKFFIPDIEAGSISKAFSYVEDGEYYRQALKVLINKDNDNTYYFNNSSETIEITTDSNLCFLTSKNNEDDEDGIKWKIVDIISEKDDSNILQYYAICYKQKDTEENRIENSTVIVYYKSTASSREDVKVFYERAYRLDMINNYLNGGNFNNYYWKDKNNYTSTINLSIADEKLDDDDGDYKCKDSIYAESNGKDKTYDSFIDFFPINELYIDNLKDYKITQTIDSNNESNYTVQDLKTRSRYSFSYVNKLNASNYYRMVTQQGAGVIWSFVGAILCGGVGLAVATALPWIWMYGAESIPGKNGLTTKDVFGNKNGVSPSWEYVNASYYRYFVAEDSMQRYQDYKKLFNNIEATDDHGLIIQEDVRSVFWKLLAYTYNNATDNSKKSIFTYKTNFLRLLNRNSEIAKYNNYKILLVKEGTPSVDEDENEWESAENLIFETNNNLKNFIGNSYFSSVAYYPIYNKMESLDLSNIDWSDNKIHTLNNIFSAKYNNIKWIEIDDQETPLLKITQGNKSLYFLIYREEDYIRTQKNTASIIYNPQYYDSANRVYNLDMIEIDLTKEPIYEGYYILNKVDSGFKQATEFNMDIHYYKNINGIWTRFYTIEQIMNDSLHNYSYLCNNEYIVNSFEEDQKEFKNIPMAYTKFSIRWTANRLGSIPDIPHAVANIYQNATSKEKFITDITFDDNYEYSGDLITLEVGKEYSFDGSLLKDSLEPGGIIFSNISFIKEGSYTEEILSPLTLLNTFNIDTLTIPSNTPGKYKIYSTKDNKFNFTYAGYTGLPIDALRRCIGIIGEDVKRQNKLLFKASRILVSKEIISGISNGTFWYKYKDKLDIPTLYQYAAAVQSQLTEYWMQAYTASKYCEYMIPENWTPTDKQITNYFSSKIFNINDRGEAILLSNYLPSVKIYSENQNTRLPKYRFVQKDSRIVNNYDVLNKIDTLTYNAEDENSQAILQESIETNPALKHLFMILNEDKENWILLRIGSTSYYYVTDKDSGKKWDQFVYEATKNQFGDFSGIYVMGYNRLKKSYIEMPNTEYWTWKEKHDLQWENLYVKYGYLLLEGTYKSETATTSKELLKLAQYAFKDYAKPEANYSLSIIDVASLSGYNGQEIRVGDGIRVNAQDYYNEYDQIFDSLSEYLFITDISYTLRSPVDINLTVNAIKYQDKLVQKLVKLIK